MGNVKSYNNQYPFEEYIKFQPKKSVSSSGPYKSACSLEIPFLQLLCTIYISPMLFPVIEFCGILILYVTVSCERGICLYIFISRTTAEVFTC